MWAIAKRVLCRSVGVAAVLTVAAPLVADHWSAPEATPLFLALACALPLLAMTEVALFATIGLKRLGLQVAVREIVVPLSFLPLSLILFHALGPLHSIEALAAAHVLSVALGCTVAVVGCRRVFRAQKLKLRFERGAVPVAFRRYAVPIGFGELLATVLKRSDTLLLAFVAGPAVVGVYEIAKQFANTLHSIRVGFDPIVVAVVAGRDRAHAASVRAIRAGFSHATTLVLLFVAPVALFFVIFAEWLLPLFGADFGAGVDAVRAMSACAVVASAGSLAGPVLVALGQAWSTVRASCWALGVQAVLLVWWTPALGVLGAALASGIGSLVQVGILVAVATQHLGVRPYDREVVRALSAVGLAVALLLGLFAAGGRLQDASLWTHGWVFALALLPLVWAAWPYRPRFARASVNAAT
jgi:O-antigen/teichoic acid export membrane protein